MNKPETFEQAVNEAARLLRFGKTPEEVVVQVVEDIRTAHEREVGAIAIAVANDARKDGL